MELCLVVDHACNLRCKYCYMGEKRSAPMSRDVMRQAVDFALAQNTGWLSVTLFGGEPLLVPAILPAAEQIVGDAQSTRGSQVNLRWLLDTNATRLNEGALDWLAPPRQAKVFVSLDGVAAAHDANRVDAAGRATHSRVVEGIARLRARNIAFDIVAVVNPDTARYLPDSLAFVLTLGAEQIHFQANLRAHWTETDLADFTQHARDTAAVWADEFRHGRRAIVEPFHSKVLSHLFGELHLPRRCQLATREVAVAPSGRIYPCAEMVGEDKHLEFAIGDVVTGLDPVRIAALRAQVQAVNLTCETCALNRRCLNGCGCRQWACAGRLGHVTATLCETESAWIEAADQAAESLFAENCGAFQEFYYENSWAVPASVPHPDEALVQIRSRPLGRAAPTTDTTLVTGIGPQYRRP